MIILVMTITFCQILDKSWKNKYKYMSVVDAMVGHPEHSLPSAHS